MPQGSLHDHLLSRRYGDERRLGQGKENVVSEERCKLPWTPRFSIAIDVAEGMAYLHHYCPEPVVHGDLKPSNVLLGDEMVAKVADFGISRLINLRRGAAPGEATASRVCGTMGYVPPDMMKKMFAKFWLWTFLQSLTMKNFNGNISRWAHLAPLDCAIHGHGCANLVSPLGRNLKADRSWRTFYRC